jgi:hypothetical protein
MEQMGFLDVLKEALWYGTPGACRRARVVLDWIQASILLYRDIPTLIRKTGRREMLARDRLVADAPHYIDRLAFECALVGSERGRLVVYYANIEDKFMVYDVWFKNLEDIQEEMRRRMTLLQAGASPRDLPACQPAWMSRFCKFAPGCGCADLAGAPAI